MIGTCKLCCKEKDLRHSHILPEFMYQNLYDTSPKRFYILNVDLDNSANSKRKIEQKGIREYLLCGDCEVQLSKYENYAAEIIYAKNLGNKAIIKKANETPDQHIISHTSMKVSHILTLNFFTSLTLTCNRFKII